MLTGITITGADDGVDPAELIALSREFDFVEWGILFSESRRGTPQDTKDRVVQAAKDVLAAAEALPVDAPREFTLAGLVKWDEAEHQLNEAIGAYVRDS